MRSLLPIFKIFLVPPL